jgi:hypothetical protein
VREEMKKVIFLSILILLFVFPFGAFAGTNNVNTNFNSANAGASSSANPSNSVIQNSTTNPATGRNFEYPAQLMTAPVTNYLGPWVSGWNVLDDLSTLPSEISVKEAEDNYDGGVTAKFYRMADGSIQYKAIKLLSTLPMKNLLDKDGNPIKTKDGKEIMVPDGKRFAHIGYIYLNGSKKATTHDVLYKAVMIAGKNGASAIVLLKRVTGTGTESSGSTFGLTFVAGSMNTPGTISTATSAGLGVSSATAKPLYEDGWVVLAIQELESKPTGTKK